MMTELADWDSFYVMAGSAAGALIGLQFVVLTILDQKLPNKGGAQAGAAFLTPTIVHFGVTLLLSALFLAPWQSAGIPATLSSLIGLCGLGYTVITALRMRRQEAYPPGLEDWLFHVVLPLAAYALLASSFFAESSYQREIWFGVGAAALLLLFIGIHNAWDNIAYTVFVHHTKRE